MASFTLNHDRNLGLRHLWLKWAPPCGDGSCGHHSGWLRRWRGRAARVLFEGQRFCADGCLERAVARAMQRADTAARSITHHRIPLGLLLLSRRQLTVEQLRTALATQRAAGRGRIGDWLQELGFVTEEQVTAAVARQWSCPVLRMNPVPGGALPQLPLAIMHSFSLIPVDFVPASGTLHIAFRNGIDYGVLYAIEQMLELHTEPCMALASIVDRELNTHSECRGDFEITFERSSDTREVAAVLCNYTRRVAATELRLASCGLHLWARLFRANKRPLDLLFLSSQSLPRHVSMD